MFRSCLVMVALGALLTLRPASAHTAATLVVVLYLSHYPVQAPLHITLRPGRIDFWHNTICAVHGIISEHSVMVHGVCDIEPFNIGRGLCGDALAA